MGRRSIQTRNAPEFKKLIEEIKLENMKEGKLLSDARITLAIARIPGLKEEILKRGIKNDKK